MTPSEFDALVKATHEKYQAALVSLESLRWLIDAAPAPAAAPTRPAKNHTKPKIVTDLADGPDAAPGALCENACGRKLRSDSKTCEACGKRLCSGCRPLCAECKKVD